MLFKVGSKQCLVTLSTHPLSQCFRGTSLSLSLSTALTTLNMPSFVKDSFLKLQQMQVRFSSNAEFYLSSLKIFLSMQMMLGNTGVVTGL